MFGRKTGFYFSILASLLLLLGLPSIGRGSDVAPDLTSSPDYRQIASRNRREDLAALRDALGAELAARWKPSVSGRSGSCAQNSFAAWVDLYQWLDLLESDESAVMGRWIARHVAVAEDRNGTNPTMHITIRQPGTASGNGNLPAETLGKILADNAVMSQLIGKLVAQPYTLQQGLLIERLSPEFVAATLSDPDFLKRWSQSISQDDVAPKVLLNLQAIWKNYPGDWKEFQSLALALALVKDQPAPEGWPHHQVAPADVPREESAPEELFGRWVRAFRDGKLRMDPRQLEVGELKFVVDAPLRESEFDSIRNTPQLAHQDPQKAFESIVYDQGRAVKGVYDWPWGPYLLTNIRSHGGICVDQAYYAAITGKALGIPAIFFSGQGQDGGHAWVGFLKNPGHWNLDVGRYASQNYATGEGLDPQSWTPISDHDLELITRHLGNRDFQDAARRDLVIAADFRRRGDLAGEGKALQSALKVSPENPAIWDFREEWLVRSGAPASELKEHHRAAISQFSRFSDLKAQHQQALVALALKNGDHQEAKVLSEQIIHENRGGWNRDVRNDLSSQAAWELVSERLKSGDPGGAVTEFERQLRLLGASGGGNFFYTVVAPLASKLIQGGHNDLALRVLKEAYQIILPNYDSILDRDLRKLWAAAGGAPSKPASTPR